MPSVPKLHCQYLYSERIYVKTMLFEYKRASDVVKPIMTSVAKGSYHEIDAGKNKAPLRVEQCCAVPKFKNKGKGSFFRALQTRVRRAVAEDQKQWQISQHDEC